MRDARSWRKHLGPCGVRVCLFALSWLLFSPHLLFAQEGIEARYGDIALQAEPVPRGDYDHGYLEHVLWVRNSSHTRTHRVTLSMPAQLYGAFDHGSRLHDLSRSVEVGPEALVRVSLWQPAFPSLLGDGLAVTIDGSREKDPFPLHSPSRGYYGYKSYGGGTSSPLFILLSAGVKPTFNAAVSRMQGLTGGGAAVPGIPGGMGGAGGGGPPVGHAPGGPPGMAEPEGWPAPGPPGVPKKAASGPAVHLPHIPNAALTSTPLPVTRWTTSWLGLSRYDGVVLTADELRTMPTGAQTALWQYVECGGALLVLGQATVPESWRRQQSRAGKLVHYRAGFGSCLVSPSTDYESWLDSQWVEVLTSWDQTAHPWRRSRSQLEANNDFPVVPNVNVPVVGLFLLIIVFAVLIGPVNIMLLSRRQRRIWLLWTVPAISLSTCLAVFTYMVFAEGWHGQRRTETLTLLDQTSHRAATIGWTAFYSPLTPGEGLHFSPDTELTLQSGSISAHSYYGREQDSRRACSLDWSTDQHLTHGWVTARVPTHFMVRKATLQRERVTVSREKDGSLSVVNGLGAAIQTFWYADDQGRLYKAREPIPAGGRGVLIPSDERKKGSISSSPSWGNLFKEDWLQIPRKLEGPLAADYLLPRTYLAELEGAPFLEEGLANARSQECRSRVLGILRETGDED